MSPSTISKPHRRPAGLMALAFIALLPLGVVPACQLAPPPYGPVAAVFPPWWTGRRAFAAAGTAGAVVRFGATSFIVIVAATDRARLRATGAWMLLDPRALGACSAPPSGAV